MRTYSLSVLLASILFTGISYSQEETVAPKYSNEFLALGVGADALGLANSMVAQSRSVNSTYWNQSGKSDPIMSPGLCALDQDARVL